MSEIIYQKEKRRFLVKLPYLWFFVAETGPRSCRVTAVNEHVHNYEIPAGKMVRYIVKNGHTPQNDPKYREFREEHTKKSNRRFWADKKIEVELTGRIFGYGPSSTHWEREYEEFVRNQAG